MLHGATTLAKLLRDGADHRSQDPLVILPQPDLDDLEKSGAASIDLRLGTWFLTPKKTRQSLFDIYSRGESSQEGLSNKHFVPFKKKFILHPHSFVLAATLEWVRVPSNLAGYVTGKSSWGRRGLVIETAPGVHPGFTGCLTLELANVGEIPIALSPGTKICQLFLHKVDAQPGEVSQSTFNCRRQPIMSEIKLDSFAEKLGPPT